MQHTANYNLPQWEANDRVKRTDFNTAMSAIDAALAGAGVRIEVGTYVGDGEETRVISLGFTPKAVLFFPYNGTMYSTHQTDHYYYGGIISSDLPLIDLGGNAGESIVTGGFTVQIKIHTVNASRHMHLSNSSGMKYYYLAIG